MWKKRVLAIVMAVLMAFSLLPSMVFAAAPSGELGGKLKLKGKGEVGSTLSADYEKVTPEGVTDEYVSFSWSRKTGEELTEVGKEKTYVVAEEDLGAEIVLEIKGLEDMGLSGSLKVTSVIIAAEGEGTEATKAEEEENTEETVPEEEIIPEEPVMEESVPEEEALLEEESGLEYVEEPELPQGELSEDEGLEEIPEATEDGTLEQSEMGNEENWENTETAPETPAVYSAEATTEDGSGTLNFGNVVDGQESETEPQYIYVQNTGSGTLHFESASPEYFMVQDISEPLDPEDAISLWVQPREGLEPGSYQDQIVYTSAEGTSVSVPAEVTITEKAEEPKETYALRAEPGELTFAPLKEGYESAEEALKVSLYNDGQTPVTITLGKTDYFDVKLEGEGSLENYVLSPGTSCSLQVRPVVGLTAGSYSNDLIFSILEDTSIQAVVRASVEVQKEEAPVVEIKAEPSAVEFDTVTEGYETAPEARSVTLTNTGNREITLVQPEAKNFRIGELSQNTLKPGESASFSIQPKEGLKAGEYSGKIAVKNAEDSSTLTSVKVSWKVQEKEETFKLAVTPDMLDFGSMEEGYEKAPKAQTVTVTNKGTGTITLEQPQSEYYEVSALSLLVLKAGESASFTVQPKKGLTYSEYLEVIKVPNDAQVQALVNSYFSVTEVKEKLVSVSELDPITGIKNGAEKSAKGLKLPSGVSIRTSKGKSKASISWDVKNCAYNPKSTEKQTFTVSGKISLPKGVTNPDGISQKVSVKVSVKAYEPKVPSTDKNYISGIKGEGYTTESKITFTAVGAGMDNAKPRKGDVRYVPLNWTVLNTNSWSAAPYTASFGLSQKGSYTLSVVYNQQKFDGSNWVNTGEQDTKKVGFQVAAAANSKVTPTPAGNQKNPVKTGDDTPILPFVIALVAALAIGAGVVVYRKKK